LIWLSLDASRQFHDSGGETTRTPCHLAKVQQVGEITLRFIVGRADVFQNAESLVMFVLEVTKREVVRKPIRPTDTLTCHSSFN